MTVLVLPLAVTGLASERALAPDAKLGVPPAAWSKDIVQVPYRRSAVRPTEALFTLSAECVKLHTWYTRMTLLTRSARSKIKGWRLDVRVSKR